MPAKPMPQLRPKPTTAQAEAFLQGRAPEMESAPAAVATVASIETAKVKRGPKAPAEPSAKRRVNLYLSKETTRALKLASLDQERDMSDIVEELLAKHLRRSA